MWKRDNRLDSVLNKLDTVIEKQANMHTDFALIQKDHAENKNNIKSLDTRVKVIEKPFNYIKTTISLILLFGFLGGAVFSVQRVLPVKAAVETVKEIE